MKLKKILLAGAIVLAFSACNVRPQTVTEATVSETTATEETTVPTETTTAAPTETTAAVEIPIVPVSDSGRVFNIYTINNEFQTIINDYYFRTNIKPAELSVNFIIGPENDVGYGRKLEADILANATAESSKKVDLFTMGVSYSNVFADTKYAVPVSQLGITENELSDQFPYFKTLSSDASGVQMGIGYQNCAELVIYRKSIARAVLGTDNPDSVSGYLDTFAKFDETAKKMKTAGYTMLGSYNEFFRMYIQSADSGITVSGTDITIPKAWKDWADSAKSYADNGYALKCVQWEEEWCHGMEKDSKVFSYIGPRWQSEYNVAVFTDIKDDWDYCFGPAYSYWGGSVVFAANGTDNASFAADIMRFLATDKAGLKKLATDSFMPPNSMSVSAELGDRTMPSELGASRYYPVTRIAEAAKKIDIKSVSKYNYLSETFEASMADYIEGNITYEQALENFNKNALDLINGTYEPTPPIPDGEVTEVEIRQPDGRIALYTGTIKNGVPNGKGTLYYADYWPDQKEGAYVTEEGTFENGKLVGDYVRTMPHFADFTRIEYSNTFEEEDGNFTRRVVHIEPNGDKRYQDDIVENWEEVDWIYYDGEPPQN
jgi:hypothetical protein